MDKAPLIFDSRNRFFKSPQGAVESDTELTFQILVTEDLDPFAVRLIIRYDRHDAPAVYEMGLGRDGDFDVPETDFDTSGYREFSVSFRIHDTGLYWYHFEVDSNRGTLRFGKDPSNSALISDDPNPWQQTVYRRAYPAPEWIYGGIYYHIFVDRFHKSGRPRVDMEGKITRHDWGGQPLWRPENGEVLNNDFFGGDLEGIRQKLPYLADLHVNCIYLSPIFEAYSNHKYDTGDYERIDPMFGDEEDFTRLCRDAAGYGIRIICDGVFSHTGADSRYFDRYGHYAAKATEAGTAKTTEAGAAGAAPLEAGAADHWKPGAYEDPASEYRSWYYFHEDGTYDCWWDFPTLPRINKSDPGYIEYITGENGIARRWLRAGASGWRLDVADELPVPFLDALTRAVKEEKTDALVIGEVWEDASNKTAYDERKNYFEGNRLDSVMNYPFREAIIDFVRKGDSDCIVRTVESIVENYPPEVLNCLMNVLGTHDSIRIITALAGRDLGADPARDVQAQTNMDEEEWKLGIRMLKTASLLQMTLPGVPCIYYGDEAGTEGYKDPFNRTCYPWGREKGELLNWYRKITSLRTSERVYAQGSYRTLAACEGLFAFERYEDGDPASSIITAANCSQREHHLSLEDSRIDLLTDQPFKGTVTLLPGEALLLKKSEGI